MHTDHPAVVSQKKKSHGFLGAALAALCTVLALGSTLAAPPAQARSTTFQLDIPEQSLEAALQQVALASQHKLLYKTDLVEGKNSPAIKGEFTTEGAVQKLLVGTDLTYDITASEVVLIRAGSAPPVDTSKEKQVPSTTSTGSSKDDVKAGGDQKKSFWERFRVAQVDQGQAATDGAVEKSNETSDTKEGEKLEEIVVTAQKRKERLRDVPISISVLPGEDLDAGSDRSVNDALRTVPGVSIGASAGGVGGGSLVTVRGVAATGAVLNGSSPVAFYLDGIPFGLVKSAMVPDANAYDLNRVEVLRGPQGTLYGANALNGVVRVLTNDADLHEFGAKARVSTSGTSGGEPNYRGDAALNIPIITDRLAVRGVGSHQQLGGYIDTPSENNYNDGEISDVRLNVGMQPYSNLSGNLSYWRSRTTYDSLDFSNDDYQYFYHPTTPQTTETGFDAYNARVEYDSSWGTLTSSTSHIAYTSENPVDLDFANLGALDSRFTSRVTSQEVVLTSVDGQQLTWSIGAFYRDARDRLHQTSTSPDFLPAPIDFTDASESYAIFGETTLHLLDGTVELTGGLRYFEDEVRQIENLPSDGDLSRPLIRSSATFDALTPRVVLTWHPSENHTLYASYAQGFRSGFNQSAIALLLSPTLPPAEPDMLTNYEIGAKGEIPSGRVRYEAAAYFIDWQDTQQSFAVPIPGVPPDLGGVIATLNAISASGPGFDLSLSADITSRLSGRLALNVNDITADEDLVAVAGIVLPQGSRLANSPELTVGAGFDYVFPIGQNEATFSVASNYTSERNFQGVGFFLSSEDKLISSARFTLATPHGLEFSIFGDNITDEARNDTTGSGDFQILTRPRTVGLQLEYSFK